jgi:hypothetical protein
VRCASGGPRLGRRMSAACSSAPSGGQGARSCVPPSSPASMTSIGVGESLNVSGQWFWTDCGDVATNGEPPSPGTPVGKVRLVLHTHGGQTFDVGTARPDTSGSFTVTISVPNGAEPGAARLEDKAALGSSAEFVIHA